MSFLLVPAHFSGLFTRKHKLRGYQWWDKSYQPQVVDTHQNFSPKSTEIHNPWTKSSVTPPDAHQQNVFLDKQHPLEALSGTGDWRNPTIILPTSYIQVIASFIPLQYLQGSRRPRLCKISSIHSIVIMMAGESWMKWTSDAWWMPHTMLMQSRGNTLNKSLDKCQWNIQ